MPLSAAQKLAGCGGTKAKASPRQAPRKLIVVAAVSASRKKALYRFALGFACPESARTFAKSEWAFRKCCSAAGDAELDPELKATRAYVLRRVASHSCKTAVVGTFRSKRDLKALVELVGWRARAAEGPTVVEDESYVNAIRGDVGKALGEAGGATGAGETDHDLLWRHARAGTTVELQCAKGGISLERAQELHGEIKSWDRAKRFEFFRLINPKYLTMEDEDKLSDKEWFHYAETVVCPPKGKRRNFLDFFEGWAHRERKKREDRDRKKKRRRAIQNGEITDPEAVASDAARKVRNRENMRARRKEVADRVANGDATTMAAEEERKKKDRENKKRKYVPRHVVQAILAEREVREEEC